MLSRTKTHSEHMSFSHLLNQRIARRLPIQFVHFRLGHDLLVDELPHRQRERLVLSGVVRRFVALGEPGWFGIRYERERSRGRVRVGRFFVGDFPDYEAGVLGENV